MFPGESQLNQRLGTVIVSVAWLEELPQPGYTQPRVLRERPKDHIPLDQDTIVQSHEITVSMERTKQRSCIDARGQPLIQERVVQIL
jgi:hypothetical protein